MADKPIIRMENIVKDFDGIRALDGVELEAYSGELLALCGENGAGKSTLMKVLSGVWPAKSYQGTMYIDGKPKRFKEVADAEKEGITIIHQELNLIPELTVAQNIFLNQEYHRWGIIDTLRIRSQTRELLDEFHLDIAPQTKARDLTVGKQQMVEIVKALSKKSRILILDEPTSALSEAEVQELFGMIDRLKKQNVCLIYISHKLKEIQLIADKILVLRDGKSIGKPETTASLSVDDIITLMVDRPITEMYPKQYFQRKELVLEVKNMNVFHPLLPGEKRVKQASFKLYKGEILGIFGLMGSGRTELVSGVFGCFPKETEGQVFIDGQEIAISRPKDAIRQGMGLVCEDRKRLGLILDMDTVSNTTLPLLGKAKFGDIPHRQERIAITKKLVEQLHIKVPNLRNPVSTLSGGNQQKVAIAKWLATELKILLLDEPTRGVDIGAKVEIYKLMNQLVEEGIAVLMISSELPEILQICHRILVMHNGKIVTELTDKEATEELVMAYATTGGEIKENTL